MSEKKKTQSTVKAPGEVESKPQRILVFQQRGSAEKKITGIEQYGRNRFEIEVISIDDALPPIIDEADEYFPDRIEADLVLDFLPHPDLSLELGDRCRAQGTPVVAKGKKVNLPGVFAPPT